MSAPTDDGKLRPLVAERAAKLRAWIAASIPKRYESTLNAEDVLQDVWVAVFRSLPELRRYGLESLDYWLRRIAMSKLTDAIRAARRGKRGEGHIARWNRSSSYTALFNRVVAPGKSPSGEAAAREAADAVGIALASMPDRYQDVVNMRFVEHLSHAEIAERMGRSESAVNSLIRGALRKLRARLGRASDYLSSG